MIGLGGVSYLLPFEVKRTVVLSIRGAALALLTQGCSLVFDTDDLVGAGGPASGGGGSTSHTGGGGSEEGGAGAQGGGGSPPCECEERDDILWLVTAEDVALDAAAPSCPAGTSVLDGFLGGSVSNEAATCVGQCEPVCELKLGRSESGNPNCTVSGSTVPGDDTCATATLQAGDGDEFAIFVSKRSCTATELTIEDPNRGTRVNVCEPDEDSCSLGPETIRCIPRVGPECDACFPAPRSVHALEGEHSCDTAIATCQAPCVGDLRRYSDAVCATAMGAFAYEIADEHQCGASPAVTENGVATYWRFDWDGQACDATGLADGSVTLGEAIEEYCCER